MRRIVLSRLYLAKECPGSHSDIEWTSSFKETWATRIGNALHYAMEHGLDWKVITPKWKLTPRMVEIVAKMYRQCDAWRATKDATHWTQEARYDYNAITGVGVLNRGVVSPDFAHGRFDVADPVLGSVGDWKTGRNMVDHPKDNPQIWGAAVMLAATHGLSEVTGWVCQVGEDDIDVREHKFNTAELERRAGDLREIQLRVINNPIFRPGGHCKYCPAKEHCTTGKEYETMGSMKLSSIVTGAKKTPIRVLIHGADKVGKSTWAASAPKPVFIGLEGGLDQLGPARFPEPRSFDDVLEAIKELRNGGHDFKTLVIDPLNWLEAHIFESVCIAGGKTNIEDVGGGYRKGYKFAEKYWLDLTSKLDELRESQGMNIILLCHSQVKNFKNTEAQDWGKQEPSIDSVGAEVLKRWVDVIGYARMEEFAVQQSKNDRARGKTTGSRVLLTNTNAAYAAGNRFGLPDQLPLQWSAFDEAVNKGASSVTDLKAKARAIAAELGPEVVEKCEHYLSQAGQNTRELIAVIDGLNLKRNQTS